VGAEAEGLASDSEAHQALSRIPQRIGAPGITRPGVTRSDLARVYAAGARSNPSHEQIRALVLSLEQNPSDVEAQEFADQMASELIRLARTNGAVEVPDAGDGSDELGGASASGHLAAMLHHLPRLASSGTPFRGGNGGPSVRGPGGAPDDPICLD